MMSSRRQWAAIQNLSLCCCVHKDPEVHSYLHNFDKWIGEAGQGVVACPGPRRLAGVWYSPPAPVDRLAVLTRLRDLERVQISDESSAIDGL